MAICVANEGLTGAKEERRSASRACFDSTQNVYDNRRRRKTKQKKNKRKGNVSSGAWATMFSATKRTGILCDRLAQFWHDSDRLEAKDKWMDWLHAHPTAAHEGTRGRDGSIRASIIDSQNAFRKAGQCYLLIRFTRALHKINNRNGLSYSASGLSLTTNRVTRIHEYDHSPAATEDKKKRISIRRARTGFTIDTNKSIYTKRVSSFPLGSSPFHRDKSGGLAQIYSFRLCTCTCSQWQKSVECALDHENIRWRYSSGPPFSFLSVRYIPSYGGRFELCLVSLFPLDSAEVLYISGSGWKGARSDLLRYLKRAARGGVGRVRKTNSFSRIIPPSLSLSLYESGKGQVRLKGRPLIRQRPLRQPCSR